MKKHPKSMTEARQNLLSCYNELQAVGFIARTFQTSEYEMAYRRMMDAIRMGSQWLEHGKGTKDEKAELFADQVMVEQYVRDLGFNWNHPWNKGT
jgi:hypothetical protein